MDGWYQATRGSLDEKLHDFLPEVGDRNGV